MTPCRIRPAGNKRVGGVFTLSQPARNPRNPPMGANNVWHVPSP